MEGSGFFTTNTCIEEYDNKKKEIIGYLTKIDGFTSILPKDRINAETKYLKFIYEFYNILQVIRSEFPQDEKQCDNTIELALHLHAYNNNNNNDKEKEIIKNHWSKKNNNPFNTEAEADQGKNMFKKKDYKRMFDIVNVVQIETQQNKGFSSVTVWQTSTKIITFKYTKPSKKDPQIKLVFEEKDFSGAIFKDTFTKLIKLFIEQMQTYLKYLEDAYKGEYVNYNKLVKQISKGQQTSQDNDDITKIQTSSKIIAYVSRN